MFTKPIIYLPLKLKMWLDSYIRLAPGEISGLGEVEVTGGYVQVVKLHLFNQVCTPVHTHLDNDSLADFTLQAMKENLPLERMKVWWHAHDKSDIFWSAEDEKTIERFRNSGWFVSLVGNKAGDYLARLDFWQPLRATVTAELFTLPSPEIMAAVQREIAEKVSVPAIKTYLVRGRRVKKPKVRA